MQNRSVDAGATRKTGDAQAPAAMRVLAVIIAHPLRKVCGATNAGRELSVATAELVNLELAIMWDADEELTLGRLPVHHIHSSNRLGPLTEITPRVLRIPLYDSRIPEMVKRGGYDLVHIHNLVPTLAAERVARACVTAGVPYIISTHGFNELSRYAEINGFGRLKTLLAEFGIARPFRRVVQGAEAIFALSDCEQPLLDDLGVGPERVHVVTNGVNEFYLGQPTEEETRAVREKYRIGSGPVLFYMGSLHRYKGSDIFLRSLLHVKGPFQAVLGGSFKNESEPGRALEEAQLGRELGARVTFTGRLSDSELRALYHLADVFVYPTQGDTLPLVVLEAMACGRPIVSTTVGGVPCAVSSEAGILTQPGDAAGVGAAVNQLLAAPEMRRRMGDDARRRVREKFRWSAAAQCAATAYGEILRGSRTKRN